MIWVDASAFVAPVVAGPPLFAAVVVDITDRKRAEEPPCGAARPIWPKRSA